MFEQERQARELYKKLLETFRNTSTNISIDEPGLHWHCSLNRSDRQCVIHCFGEKGYAISFRINNVTKARGRTRLEKEVITSAGIWLKGIELKEMLDKFEIIDPGKRTLEKFQAMLIEDYPDIKHCTTIKFEPGLRETFCLKITSSSRFCHIHFYDHSKIPTFEFYWNDFYVFKFTLDNMLDSALILKRWFCDDVMPSVLAKEFPSLDKGELSEYSDFSKVIEAGFLRSGDDVEKFYNEISSLTKQDFSERLRLISQMRQNGYDRTFRAGISFGALVLSRAMFHGLKMDQPCLIFEFIDDSKINIYTSQKAYFDRKIKLSSSGFDITPQIEKLLKELEAKDIIELD